MSIQSQNSKPIDTNHDENNRLQSLHNYQILNTPPEPDYDDLIYIIAQICDTPIAFLGFADADRHWFKSQIGLNTNVLNKAIAICTSALQHDNIYTIHDTHEHPNYVDSPIVTGPPHIRTYAAVVIKSPTGHRLGTFGVCDTKPRTFNQQQINAIKTLARQAQTMLELRRVSNELLKSNKAKSQFLANVSHEIRTPITTVLGYADLLINHSANTQHPPQTLEFLQAIRRSGDHLLHMINDLLDLSKAQAGQIAVESIDFDPTQTLAHVAQLMQPHAQRKSLDLQIQTAGPIPHTIQSDPTRIQQILLNLTSNAIKFTENGSVQLTAQMATPINHVNPAIRFEVSDTGIGIDNQAQQAIFESFTQADPSTTRKHGGTGLGLTISRHLARRLGGDITLASTPAQGSTFTLTIPTGPLNHTQYSDRPTLELQPPPRPTALPKLRPGTRVLIAEDCPDNQHLMAMLLKKAGASCTTVDNGQQACTHARQALKDNKPYDVIFMDIQMPLMDGYDATRYLRHNAYTLPIIAITAHAMPHEKEKCLQAGCDHYITKPVEFDELIDTIFRFTENKACAS